MEDTYFEGVCVDSFMNGADGSRLESMAYNGCPMAMYSLANVLSYEDDANSLFKEIRWYSRFLETKAVKRIIFQHNAYGTKCCAIDYIVDASIAVGLYYGNSSNYDEALLAFNSLATACDLMDDENENKDYWKRECRRIHEYLCEMKGV